MSDQANGEAFHIAHFYKSDVPLLDQQQDAFGRKYQAQRLTEYILNRETPFTIGIHGDWGSGKTTIVNFIIQNCGNPAGDFIIGNEEEGLGDFIECREREFTYLGSKNNYRTYILKFNSWCFGNMSNLDIAFLAFFSRSIRAIYNKELGRPSSVARDALARIGAALKTIAIRTAPIVPTAVGALLGLPISSIPRLDVASESRDTEQDKQGYLGNAEYQILGFKNHIGVLLNEIVSKHDSKVTKFLIVIDDLDRVNPVDAFRLTETLKIYLDIKGCAFLLVCDEKIIRRGMRDEFQLSSTQHILQGGILDENNSSSERIETPEKDRIDLATRGREYIDKIIQVSYQVPDLSLKDVQSYMNNFTFFRILNNILTIYPKCAKRSELEKYVDMIKMFPALVNNPRNLKKLLNNFELSLHISGLYEIIVKKSREGTEDECILELCNPKYRQVLFLNCIYQISRTAYDNLRQFCLAHEADVDIDIGVFLNGGISRDIGSTIKDDILDAEGWKSGDIKKAFTAIERSESAS